MAKFHGIIGFMKTMESSSQSGVWNEMVTEKTYRGDIMTRSFRPEDSGNLNDNVVTSNKISIVADSFAKDCMGYMKYVVLHGVPWKITGIEPMYPRLILTLGGIYNKPADTQCSSWEYFWGC